MQLTVISSNSSGNCYILENQDEALLIECGVRFSRIKEALKFNLSKVKGCIISHEHLDHCKGVKDVLAAGINVLASEGSIKAFGITHHRLNIIKSRQTKMLGGFEIKAFDVQHDCAEPLGFLIRHKDCGLVLFLTDSYYTSYTFPGLNNVIVEANCCQRILDERVAGGVASEFLRNRVISSHMSLDTCKEFLAANDLSKVNNIVLIHLSDSNSDASRFQKEVKQLTACNVTVAQPGLTIPFNLTPF